MQQLKNPASEAQLAVVFGGLTQKLNPEKLVEDFQKEEQINRAGCGDVNCQDVGCQEPSMSKGDSTVDNSREALIARRKKVKPNTESVREYFLAEGRIIPDDWIYTGTSTPIPFWCTKGQHYSEQTRSNFRKGADCGGCTGRSKKSQAEKIRKAFSEAGRIVPDDWVYKGNKEAIPYWCEKGQHNHEQLWSCFERGYGCGRCAGRNPQDEEIREKFLKAGRMIPDDWTYAGSQVPIPYWCIKGEHNHQQGWTAFMQGLGCLLCSGRVKKNGDEVRQAFLDAGRVIPDNWEYIDNSTPIPFWCTKGQHNHEQAWNHFRNGKQCGKCAGRSKEDKDIRDLFLEAGRVIPEDWTYKDISTPIPFWCIEGQHYHQQNLDNFKLSKRCGKCAGRNKDSSVIRQAFLEAGREIPDDWVYEFSHEPIPFWCIEGQHYHQQIWDNFQKGFGCSRCAGQYLEEDGIREAFTAVGRDIPEDWTYKNSSEPIPFWCIEGQHYHQQSWASFKNGSGCLLCSSNWLGDEKIREAFKSAGREIPEDWTYQGINEPIPFWCIKGQHYHQQSWVSFRGGAGCGRCFEEEKPFLAWIFTLPQTAKWVAGRIGHLDSVVQQALSKLSEEKLTEIKNILNSRKPFEHTDHIVPYSFFDVTDWEQILALTDPVNLRNIPGWANRSRSNDLTISEIKMYFHDQELRRIYNSASCISKKQERNLPDQLPVEDTEFMDWCKRTELTDEDFDKFHRWHDQLIS